MCHSFLCNLASPCARRDAVTQHDQLRTRAPTVSRVKLKMPLILNEEPDRGGAGTGFDLQTATTLFWKPVPVLLRQADREDQQEELTFRILNGVSRSNHNMRVRAATMLH